MTFYCLFHRDLFVEFFLILLDSRREREVVSRVNKRHFYCSPEIENDEN